MFIETSDTSFSYDTESNHKKDALRHVNLSVKKGEFIAIVGHNGSGKSTLAKHFNAILLPSNGDVTVDQMNTKDSSKTYEIRRRVGLVLQNPDNQIVASIVEEDVAFAPENLGVPPDEIRKRVNEALKIVDMYDQKESESYKLSGGQKQRLTIAGIIAMLPDCIVLDEPTAMLDPKGRSEVLNTIKSLNREKKITVILITHFMEEAAMADKIIVIDHGKIQAKGTPREIFTQVDLLENCKLALPQCAQLIHRLKADGFNLPDGILTEDECVSALLQLLEEI